MPTPAEMVAALYDRLGRWQAVADACSDGRDYSPAYYWRVAHGEIKPSKAARRGIVKAAKALGIVLPLVKRPQRRIGRKNASFEVDTWNRMQAAKSALGLTWFELGDRMIAALERELRDEGEGDDA